MRTGADRVRDELLVLGAQDGDAGALEALARRWSGPLLDYAWRKTGDREAAGDVTQEAWMHMVRGIGRLDDPALFRAWAYRIVTHKCADWVRRRVRERAADETMRERAAESANRYGSASDSGIDVIAALGTLDEERRAMLSMRYIGGLSMREMAAALGVPTGTVKSRLHQAKNELRERLEGDTR